MPTYEYRCRTCGEQLEVVQSFRDAALTEHAGCGGELRKVFHPVGIAFKGSGFYKTDSRSSSKAKSNGNGDSSKSSEKSTESKSSSSDSSSSSTSSTSNGSSSGKESKATSS